MTTQVDLSGLLEALSADHPLTADHRAGLLAGGIDTADHRGPAVIAMRGYATITADTPRTAAVYGLLRDVAGFSTANLDHCAGNGTDTLVLPSYDVDGGPNAIELKPGLPRVGRDGRERKYLRRSGKGTSRMDFGPAGLRAFAADVSDETDRPIVFTEGVKKGDALRARGVACIVLPGVTQWDVMELRDVPWEGRTAYVCFDADAATNPSVAKQRDELCNWLVRKHASVKVIDLPGVVNGESAKGLDDHLVAGMTLDELFGCARDLDQVVPAATVAKNKRDVDAVMSSEEVRDARLADMVAEECFAGKWIHTDEAGWLQWDGTRWRERGSDDDRAVNDVAKFLKSWFDGKAAGMNWTDPNAARDLGNYQRVLDAYAIGQACRLARGNPLVKRDLADFDTDPNTLNTPSGLLDLRTRTLTPHDPSMLVTKITDVDYVPGARHDAWDSALSALPSPEVRDWFQIRMGEMMFGRPPARDDMLLMNGPGANGKSTIMEPIETALGDYARRGSPLIFASTGKEAPTELCDLRGLRLALFSELPDGRMMSESVIKRSTDSHITARPLFKKSMTFRTTHLSVTVTNHDPIITGSDIGIWRRLVKIPLPWSFLTPTSIVPFDPGNPSHVPCDARIKQSLLSDRGARQAVMCWLVEGALKWFEGYGRDDAPETIVEHPKEVSETCSEWRASADPTELFMKSIMILDDDGVVLATDVLAAYNGLGEEHGGRRINSRTLKIRLTSDAARAKISRGVEGPKAVRVPDVSKVSRDTGPYAPVTALKPGVHQCYTGLRFRTDADNLADAIGVDMLEAAELITATAAASADPFNHAATAAASGGTTVPAPRSDVDRNHGPGDCVESGCPERRTQVRDSRDRDVYASRCADHVTWCGWDDRCKCLATGDGPHASLCVFHASTAAAAGDDECADIGCDDDVYVPSVSPLCRMHLQERAEDAYGEDDYDAYLSGVTPYNVAVSSALGTGGDYPAAAAALARWLVDAALSRTV